jgi:hypothetical protein
MGATLPGTLTMIGQDGIQSRALSVFPTHGYSPGSSRSMVGHFLFASIVDCSSLAVVNIYLIYFAFAILELVNDLREDS